MPRSRYTGATAALEFAVCAFAVLSAVQLLPAQNTAPASTISVDVKVVTLPVTVRDKHGLIVRGLTKDDFVLQEDGRPETVRYFTQDTKLPLTLGLLVDTSLSQRNVLDQERTASQSFLDQMLAPDKDKAFVIHFDTQVELLQDITDSRSKLQAALQLLEATPSERDTSQNTGNPSDGRGSRRMHGGGGTLLYDSIYLACEELMKKQQGRKALIILSDGDDRGSKESLPTAIASAQRADTVVYSILFKDDQEGRGGFGQRGGGMGRRGGGSGWPGGGGGGSWPGGGGGRGQRPQQASRPDGKKVLEQISKETGGRLYEVSKKEPIEQIYSSIADELRTQYQLGYTPDKNSTGGGYHKIVLTTTRKDLKVQTRDGYYADR